MRNRDSPWHSPTSCIAIAGMSIITIIHTELRPNQCSRANSAYRYCTGCEEGEDFQVVFSSLALQWPMVLFLFGTVHALTSPYSYQGGIS